MAFPKLMKPALSLAVVALLFSACSKEAVDGPTPVRTVELTQAQKQRLVQLSNDAPTVGIYNRTMDKILVFKRQKSGDRSFSFTAVPANGINFASSNGGQWVWTQDGGMVVLTGPQAGLGAGGGTVVAGSASLNINIAVCFAVGEDAMGDGLFGPDMGNVAGVIGISGDFEALANGDFDENEDEIWDYFHGFAYYFVYADQLGNQSYEVLNWIDDLDQPESDLHNFSFAFVVSTQNGGGIYLSKDGSITVNGGSMEFQGNYFAVEGLDFFNDEDSEPNVTEVPGFGAMGCN